MEAGTPSSFFFGGGDEMQNMLRSKNFGESSIESMEICLAFYLVIQEYVKLDTTSSHLFYMYGQLQPGPGLSSERPDAVHTLSLPRLLEQN